MRTREQIVQGEWFEIRERWRHPRRIAEYLGCLGGSKHFDLFALSAGNGLQQAVEGGVLEFKRTQVSAMYAQLAEAAYGNRVFRELESLAHRAGAIQLVIAYQRALLAEEIVPEVVDLPSGTDAHSVQQRHINDIVSDVRNIIAADPKARLNTSIKNIVLQLQRYRQEQEVYRKLKQQMHPGRVEQYTRNFAATFRRICDSIRRNYAAYLEHHARLGRQAQCAGLVRAAETDRWRKLLFAQAEDMARLRGVAIYTLREQSGMRGPLIEESRGSEAVMARIDAERSHAEDAGGSEAAGAKLLRNLALHIERLLRRNHPWD